MEKIKIIMFGLFFLLLVAYSVDATAPTTPTLSPDGYSYWFNPPYLTCSGSTDAESDPINYTFVSYSGVTDSPVFYNATCQQAWCNSNASNFPNPGGNDYLAIDVSPRGDWIGTGGGFLAKAICERGENENYYLTPGTGSWDTQQDTCRNINASTDNWHLAAVDSTDENDLLANLCDDVNYCYIAGYTKDSNTTWRWIYNATGNETLQSSSSTTYNWTDFWTTGINPKYEKNWSCYSCDDNGECSDTATSAITTMLNFSACSGGSTLALNFTIKDEENESILLSSFGMAGTLNSGYDTFSYGINPADNTTFLYCLTPAGHSADITATIEYLPNSTDYTFPRQYYFDDNSITGGNQQDITLYNLIDSLASAVTFSVIRGGQYISNIIIHLQRYDVATDSYKLVGMGKSSAAGTDIIYLRLTDAFYRVLAYEDGTGVYSGGAQHIVDTSYLIDLGGGTGGGFSNYSGIYTNFNDIVYSLYYNNNTGNVVLVYDAPSGYTSQNCLKLDQYDSLNGTNNICYDCLTSSSGTISCAIPDNNSYYVAKYIVYNGDIWANLEQIAISLKAKIADVLGKDGAFISFIFLGIMAFVAIFSAVGALILTLFGLALLAGFGLLDISWTTVMMIIVAGGIILFKLTKK